MGVLFQYCTVMPGDTGQLVWMFVQAAVLSSLMPSSASLECLALAHHWLPSLVSLMCSGVLVEI